MDFVTAITSEPSRVAEVLWARTDDDAIQFDGEASVADQLRALVVDATQ